MPRESGFDYDKNVSGPTVYTYVGDNPSSYADPMGLDAWFHETLRVYTDMSAQEQSGTDPE